MTSSQNLKDQGMESASTGEPRDKGICNSLKSCCMLSATAGAAAQKVLSATACEYRNRTTWDVALDSLGSLAALGP